MSRSYCMKGRAMFTMVPSSTTISCATEMSTSAHPRWSFLPELVLAALATSVIRRSFCRGSVVRGRVAGGGRQDDLVDHAGDQVRRGQLAHDENAVQDDAGEGRLQQREVDVVTQLAALPGSLPDLLGEGDLGADDLAAERVGEVLVAGDRGEHAREPGDLVVVDESAHPAEDLLEVAAERAGVGRDVLD